MAIVAFKSPWKSKPPPGVPLDRSHPLARGLVYCHPLNEGAGVLGRDLGSYGRNATIDPVIATWRTTPAGLALKGTTSGPVASATGHMLVSFTHEAVFVPLTTTSQPISSISNNSGSGTADRALYLDASGHFAFGIFDGAQKVAAGTTTAVAGRAYHVVGTSDGANIRIYVNGVLEGTTAATNAFTGFSTPTLLLGQDLSNSKTLTGTDGSIVHHRVWDRPLSAGEVSTLAATPYGTFAAPDARPSFAAGTGGAAFVAEPYLPVPGRQAVNRAGAY